MASNSIIICFKMHMHIGSMMSENCFMLCGIETYNLKLSLKRALAVKTYLTENFTVPSSRIKVVGCGETLPLVSNSNEANRQINRRVEVVAE